MRSARRALPWRAALAVALATASVSAQGRLQIRAAVTADAPGDTAGMERQFVATAPDREVWVGEVVLDLPPASVQTVGLELDADGAAALSLWLADDAAAAFAALTEASVGRALAVVWDGRVLTAPVVESPIRNGMVMVTGLGAAEAERLADALREVTEAAASASAMGTPPASLAPASAPPLTASGWSSPSRSDPAGPPSLPERPPLGLDPPPGLSPSASGVPTASAASVAASARGAAERFTQALARRDWRTAAAALHPDAVRAVQEGAPDRLRLDGATVYVRSGGRDVSIAAADVLGDAPPSLARLDGQDLAALYLAGLGALGTWPPPGAALSVVAEVPDGRRVHVLMRAAADAAGVSGVAVVTLAPDADGAWRPLLPQPPGL